MKKNSNRNLRTYYNGIMAKLPNKRVIVLDGDKTKTEGIKDGSVVIIFKKLFNEPLPKEFIEGVCDSKLPTHKIYKDRLLVTQLTISKDAALELQNLLTYVLLGLNIQEYKLTYNLSNEEEE